MSIITINIDNLTRTQFLKNNLLDGYLKKIQ
jgi:hypothetical protein